MFLKVEPTPPHTTIPFLPFSLKLFSSIELSTLAVTCSSPPTLSSTHANQASTPTLLWNYSCFNDHSNDLLTANINDQFSVLIFPDREAPLDNLDCFCLLKPLPFFMRLPRHPLPCLHASTGAPCLLTSLYWRAPESSLDFYTFLTRYPLLLVFFSLISSNTDMHCQL